MKQSQFNFIDAIIEFLKTYNFKQIMRLSMTLLDENFFTALPAIILGIICFGIFMFLIFGLISKFTGMSIKNTGIVSGGDTIVDPDSLDNVASGLRKLVDKKYKIKKKIEEEYDTELQNSIAPIQALLFQCISMNDKSYRIGRWGSFGKFAVLESEILNLIGKSFSRYKSYKAPIQENEDKLTSDDLEKLDKLATKLYIQKEKTTAQIHAKYEHKIKELYKYL